MSSEAQFAVDKFACAAREFCAFIDEATTVGRQAFLLALPIQLARIFAAGAFLPAVPLVSDGEDSDSQDVSERQEKWPFVVTNLQSLLGKDDAYWSVFDPTAREEPVQGTVSGDLADIYRDLQETLRRISSGADANDICLRPG